MTRIPVPTADESRTVTAALRLTDVRKSVREGARERVVLHGVHLEVAPGAFVGLLGPSGSGKSTLLNVTAGIDVADGGSVEVLGTDLAALAEADRTRFRRRHLGMVFQLFHLLPTLTVEENVLLPLDLDGRGDGSARERVRSLCARVGLGDRLASYPDVLSGGEQQRVALARAVVARPGVLLADEPTGSLDAGHAETVLELLDEMRREEGCTVLLATHSSTAAARCDRIVHLRDGRITPSSAAVRA